MFPQLMIGLVLLHVSQTNPSNTTNKLCTCPTKKTITTSTLSRNDYWFTPGIGAHKLHTRAATWNKARQICNDEGGHLAIVNSMDEAKVLINIFDRVGKLKGAYCPHIAFIGIHDMYNEGEWVTILDQSLSKTGYAVWSEYWGGQPDNGGGISNCGAFLSWGTFDDVPCTTKYAFFCELPIQFITL